MIYIGNVKLSNRLVLAPMAGVTDLSFRKICSEMGAGLTVSEMVSSKAMHYNDKKTAGIYKKGEGEHPYSVQIFGSDPSCMAEAASKIEIDSGCDIIDINMGCPVNKISSNGDGSALMGNIELASKIISAVSRATKLPTTVKFRKGLDDSRVNCIEFAQMAEQSGAGAIAIHGRTRKQMYSGSADMDIIRMAKEKVKIPVIANGDIKTPEDAARVLEYTGADLIMIGRGAMGNPWIFKQINDYLVNGEPCNTPDLKTKMSVAARHILDMVEHKGEHIAILEARKHLLWYLRGVPESKLLKSAICRLSSVEEMNRLILDN